MMCKTSIGEREQKRQKERQSILSLPPQIEVLVICQVTSQILTLINEEVQVNQHQSDARGGTKKDPNHPGINLKIAYKVQYQDKEQKCGSNVNNEIGLERQVSELERIHQYHVDQNKCRQEALVAKM